MNAVSGSVEGSSLVSRLRRDRALAAFIVAYEDLAQIIHEDNVEKGFWPEGARSWKYGVTEKGHPDDYEVPGKRNVGESLMLVVTELSEGLEGHRKDLNDDHLPHRKSLEVELADAVIRIMDLGYGLCHRVADALVEKLEYNRKRPFKHGKNF